MLGKADAAGADLPFHYGLSHTTKIRSGDQHTSEGRVSVVPVFLEIITFNGI